MSSPMKGVPVAMQDRTVVRAWVLYSMHRLSLRQCAARLLDETQYASAQSFAQALHRQFHHLGLPLRQPSCGKVAPSLDDRLVESMHGDYQAGLTMYEVAGKYAAHLRGENTPARAYHVRRAFVMRGLPTRGRGRRKATA